MYIIYDVVIEWQVVVRDDGWVAVVGRIVLWHSHMYDNGCNGLFFDHEFFELWGVENWFLKNWILKKLQFLKFWKIENFGIFEKLVFGIFKNLGHDFFWKNFKFWNFRSFWDVKIFDFVIGGCQLKIWNDKNELLVGCGLSNCKIARCQKIEFEEYLINLSKNLSCKIFEIFEVTKISSFEIFEKLVIGIVSKNLRQKIWDIFLHKKFSRQNHRYKQQGL